MEKVYLKDSDVVNELITTIPVATTEKNGLKPASDVRKEKMIATTTSRIVYEGSSSTTAISTSLLISLAAYGGGPMTLFYMTINIILEHTQHTPSIYIKILNTIIPTYDIVPLSVANQDEVDAATYIDVTQ